MGSASCSSPFRVEGEGRNNAALALRSFGDARSSCRDVCRSQMPERPPPHPLLSISLLLALRAQPVSGGLTTESWIPRRATRYRNTLILLLLLLHASLDNSRNGNLCALPFPLTLFSCLLLLSQRRPSGNSRISGPICKSIQEVRAGGFRRRPRNEGLAHDPRRFCLLTCLSPSGRAPQALGNAFRMPRCAAKVGRCSACSERCILVARPGRRGSRVERSGEGPRWSRRQTACSTCTGRRKMSASYAPMCGSQPSYITLFRIPAGMGCKWEASTPPSLLACVRSGHLRSYFQ